MCYIDGQKNKYSVLTALYNIINGSELAVFADLKV
jgi:hypothetical protein